MCRYFIYSKNGAQLSCTTLPPSPTAHLGYTQTSTHKYTVSATRKLQAVHEQGSGHLRTPKSSYDSGRVLLVLLALEEAAAVLAAADGQVAAEEDLEGLAAGKARVDVAGRCAFETG